MASIAVTLFEMGPALDGSIAFRTLTPDAIEHVGIAHAYCEGRGFVDAVQWNYYLEADVPLPGFAVRAPLISWLAIVPFCLGATLSEVHALHAAVTAAIVGSVVLVACRWMSLPAAVAAALVVSTMPGWQMVAAVPLTEAIGFAALLLIIATLPGVSRSTTGALACAAATLLAWCSRPNLGAMIIPVAGAVVWRVGVRGAIRSLSLWTYLGTFVAAVVCVHVASVLLTGYAPYEAYGVMGQILDTQEAQFYDRVYTGKWDFIQANWGAILATFETRLVAVYQWLFISPNFLHLGWVAAVVLPFGLLRREASIEQAFCALGAILLSVLVVLNYSSFEFRFLLYPALLTVLVAAGVADTLATQLASRATRWSAAIRWLPHIAFFLLLANHVAPSLPARFSMSGVKAIRNGALRTPPPHKDLCDRLPADSIVAAVMPWNVYLWCGNASLKLPPDVNAPRVLLRFLTEKHIGYIVARPAQRRQLILSGRVEEIAEFDNKGALTVEGQRSAFVLFEVRDASARSRPWSSPGPLLSAGLESR